MTHCFLLVLLLFNLDSAWAATRKYPEPHMVREVFSNLQSYSGVEGYLRVSDQIFYGNMQAAFNLTSKALGPDQFLMLNWRARYIGSTAQFQIERNRLFPGGQIEKKYKGAHGYRQYALDFYFGDMQKAHSNGSAVLDSLEKMELNWGPTFYGTTADFDREHSRLYADGSIRQEFKGPQGYVRFADLYYSGNMHLAYMNMAAVLSLNDRSDLAWGKSFHGTTADFQTERRRLMTENGIKEKYKGLAGFLRYSDEFYLGKMQKAHINVSAVLHSEELELLQWTHAFQGTTTQFRTERERLFLGTALNPYFFGVEGYVLYADLFYSGRMEKAYLNVSAVLSENEKLQLNWGAVFKGSTQERQKIRQLLANGQEEINFSQWFGKAQGLPRAVQSYMELLGLPNFVSKKTVDFYRRLVRSAVTRDEIVSLGWDSIKSKGCTQILEN